MPSPPVGTASIEITPNLDNFVERLRAKLEGIDARFPVTPDFKDFDRDMEREKVSQESKRKSDPIKVPAKADVDQFQKDLQKAVAEASKSAEANIPLTADGEKLRQEVRADVERLQKEISAKISVDAEMAAGQRAKLKADVEAFTSGLEAKIPVDVDRSNIDRAKNSAEGATKSLNAMGAVRFAGLVAGIGALIPVLGGAAAAAGGLMGALGAIGGAGLLGGSGIVGAFSAMKDQSDSSGKDAIDAAKQHRDALDSLSDAQQRLGNSQRNEADALKSITDARKDAKDAIDDLNTSVKDGELASRGAGLGYERAVQRLQEVQAKVAQGKATSLDVQEAQLAVDSAAQNITDVKVRNQQTVRKAGEANALGVEGSPQVVAAQKAYVSAQQDTAGAFRDVARAQEDLATQMSHGSTAADKFAEAMKKLSPNAQEFVLAMKALGPAWSELRQAVQDNLFAGLGGSVTTFFNDQKANLQSVLGGIATGLNTTIKDTLGGLDKTFTDMANSGAMKAFTDAVTASMTGIAPLVSDLAIALTQLTIAIGPSLGPFFKALGEALKDIAPSLGTLGAAFVQALTSLLPQLAGLIKQIAEDMLPILPQLADQLGQLGTVIGHLVPVFSGILDVLTKIPGLLPTLLAAVAAYKGIGFVKGVGETLGIGGGAAGTVGKVAAVGEEAATVGRVGSMFSGIAAALAGPEFLVPLAAVGGAAWLVAQKHKDAAEAAQRMIDKQNLLSGTLDPTSGAATQATVAAVVKDFSDRGVLGKVTAGGYDSHGFATAAAGTDEAGRKALTEQIAGKIRGDLDLVGKGATGEKIAKAGVSQEDLSLAFAGDPKKIEEVTNKLKDQGLSLNALKQYLGDAAQAQANLGSELNGTADAQGNEAAKIREQHAALVGQIEVTDQARAKFHDLGVEVIAAPDAKTITIDVPTEDQRKRLVDLGYQVGTALPGEKTVNITLDDAQALIDTQTLKERIDEATKNRYLHIDAQGFYLDSSGKRYTDAQLAAVNAAFGVPGSAPRTQPLGDSGQGSAPTGGGGGGLIGSMTSVVDSKFPGMTLTDGYRDEPGSYHSTGQAADFSDGTDDTPGMQALAGYIADNYLGQTLELIHSPFNRNIKNGSFVGDGLGVYGPDTMGQHRNHVHWAISGPLTGTSPTGTYTGPGAATADAYTPGGSGLTTYSQAALPGRQSDTKIALKEGEAAVDQANSARNAVYANPNATDAEKQGADINYQKAQNALESLNKKKFDPVTSVQGAFSKAGSILGTGLLSFFGLENSILSDSNVYNRAGADLTAAYVGGDLKLPGETDAQQQQRKADAAALINGTAPGAQGYSYVPKNLPQASPVIPTTPGSPAVPPPPGSPAAPASSTGDPVKDAVRAAFAAHGWGEGAEWDAVDWIVQHESSWNPTASAEPASDAYGLFQFLSTTWDDVGGTKTDDPYLQAVYGSQYMADRYGDPIAAQRFWQANNWYDSGGLANGAGLMLKQTLRPERVLDPKMTETFDTKLIPMLADWTKPGGGPSAAGPQYVNQFNGTQVGDYRELIDIAERRSALASVGAMAAMT